VAVPFKQIRHLLIDLDGVLFVGSTALPDAPAFIDWLRNREITFRLVTNNATLTPEQYVAKLEGMGIAVEPAEVFTSALATAIYLQREGAEGQTAYVVGEAGLKTALQGVGLRLSDRHPDWVVAGLDRQLTYESLAVACLAIRAGARFVGTNPDTSLPTERGLVPGAGAIQAALVAATGVTPVVIGKPQPTMLQLAMDQLGGTLEDTAMLGDRLDTDIDGAHALGMQSILVLTGVSTRKEAAHSTRPPTLIVESLTQFMSEWQSASRVS
jgi:4-nitrophenyl phosphatase